MSNATPAELSAAICVNSLDASSVDPSGVLITFLDAAGAPTEVWSEVTCATVQCAPNCVPPTTEDTEPPECVPPDDLIEADAISYNFYDYPEIGDPLCVGTGGVPAPRSPAEFDSDVFGGSVTDNVTALENLSMCISDSVTGSCPVVVTRTYTFTDEAGNTSDPCTQTIHVNNLFAEDAIIWHQPLARPGMSEDTDPSDGGALKYRFKLGQTIPIQVHALGCDGDITSNPDVTGTVKVLGDTADVAVDFNGVGDFSELLGETSGVMDKVNGHLKYNLDTKTLPEITDTNCYILQVTVTDESTGESVTEELRLEAR